MADLMGVREFAASAEIRARYGRAVAPSTITRMAQDGKLVLIGKKIDAAASLARLDALGIGKMRPDVAARHAAQTAQEAGHATQTAQAIPESIRHAARPAHATVGATTAATDNLDAGLETGGAGKARYKALNLHFENQLIKLGMQLARGQRFYREPVKDEAQGLGGALRAAVERLIDQTAPRLAVLSNHMDRGVLLKREARHIKRLINLEYAGALRRLRKSAKKGKAE